MTGMASVATTPSAVCTSSLLVISFRPAAFNLKAIDIGEANRDLSSYPRASAEALLCDGVVERIARADLRDFLAACAAVLRTFGLIRIATIDLDQIIHGYLFDWGTNRGVNQSRTQRLNEAFCDPEICFIYSEEELRDALTEAGFKEIRRFGLGGSSYPVFWDLPIDSNQRLILEAKKS
jgi:hypothetical protein